MPFFAARLPGSLTPVMAQGLLVFSMIFSSLLLGQRYNWAQVFGVCVVVTGVAVCTLPEFLALQVSVQRGFLFSAICLFCTYAFISLALAFKELSFARFAALRQAEAEAEAKATSGSLIAAPIKRETLSIEAVNLTTAIWQGLFLFLLWPANFRFITSLSVNTYFTSAMEAFRGQGALLLCYFAVNLAYTIATTMALKRLTASLILMVNTLNVPLVGLFFCLNVPLLGASPFRWSFVAGLGLIVMGLLTYTRSRWQRR